MSSDGKTYISKEKAERMITKANDDLEEALATMQNSDTVKDFLKCAVNVVADLLAVNAMMSEAHEVPPDQNEVQQALMTVLEWLVSRK